METQIETIKVVAQQTGDAQKLLEKHGWALIKRETNYSIFEIETCSKKTLFNANIILIKKGIETVR